MKRKIAKNDIVIVSAVSGEPYVLVQEGDGWIFRQVHDSGGWSGHYESQGLAIRGAFTRVEGTRFATDKEMDEFIQDSNSLTYDQAKSAEGIYKIRGYDCYLVVLAAGLSPIFVGSATLETRYRDGNHEYLKVGSVDDAQKIFYNGLKQLK